MRLRFPSLSAPAGQSCSMAFLARQPVFCYGGSPGVGPGWWQAGSTPSVHEAHPGCAVLLWRCWMDAWREGMLQFEAGCEVSVVSSMTVRHGRTGGDGRRVWTVSLHKPRARDDVHHFDLPLLLLPTTRRDTTRHEACPDDHPRVKAPRFRTFSRVFAADLVLVLHLSSSAGKASGAVWRMSYVVRRSDRDSASPCSSSSFSARLRLEPRDILPPACCTCLFPEPSSAPAAATRPDVGFAEDPGVSSAWRTRPTCSNMSHVPGRGRLDRPLRQPVLAYRGDFAAGRLSLVPGLGR